MNSYVNMGVGALLGTVFVLMTMSIASDSIFKSPAPERAGFAIEAEESSDGAVGATLAVATPIAVLLASADVARGESAFRKCVACHTGDMGGPNKVGPNLYDLVNRPIATHEGFGYSAAMKEFSQGGTVVWDFEHLDQFLEGPRRLVSGTSMGFAGIRREGERADLIAYLRTLSANPAPLPDPEALPDPVAVPEAQPSN